MPVKRSAGILIEVSIMNTVSFSEVVDKTLETLQKGGIILYPTDTVWGIGCDATNEAAVNQIYSLKNRPDTKSMICLVDSKAALQHLLGSIPAPAEEIINNAKRPTTVIYPDVTGVASNLLASDHSLAVRLVQDKFCKTIIHSLGRPLVSTSANISGMPTPATFADIDAAILKGVDYVVPLDHDKPAGRPSVIIKLGKDHSVTVLRE